MSDATFLFELGRALGSELSLRVSGDGRLEVVQNATGRSFTLGMSAGELALHAQGMSRSGEEAGVGEPRGSGAVAPGIALLSIHIDEAVATADPAHTGLVLHPGGFHTV